MQGCSGAIDATVQNGFINKLTVVQMNCEF